MMIEFTKFPKIPRLNRDMIITEKLDGTNAQIYIEHSEVIDELKDTDERQQWFEQFGVIAGEFTLFAGSRNRWVSRADDNYGFAKWVAENKQDLARLGVGLHYGEYWGKGIQRGYDQMKKHFSLFNVTRWEENAPLCCDVVPVLYEGPFETYVIEQLVDNLWEYGSKAAPGFMDPEGVVVFHKAANRMFKVTCKNDEMPKGQMTG